jgi:hypothetical protein
MKKLVFLLPLLLCGCIATTQTNVMPPWPEVPDDLKQACPDLALVDTSTSKLSEVISVVSTNYEQYKECKIKVDSWMLWYNTQKKIYETVK